MVIFHSYVSLPEGIPNVEAFILKVSKASVCRLPAFERDPQEPQV